MPLISRRVRARIAIPLAIIAVLFIGVSVGVYHAVALPGCTSCHSVGEFGEATEAAPHAAVDCASCHVPSGLPGRVAFGFRQAYHMVIPIVDGDGREWATVPNERCNACHDGVQTEIVSSNGIRINHPSCTENEECTSCHGATAHGAATAWTRTYDMETCLSCHVTEEVAQCDVCHEGRLPTNRVTTGVFAITHGTEWESTHGMGDAGTCVACHTAATCETCHGVGLPHQPRYVESHSTDAVNPGAKCSSCHEPAFCSDCHGIEMPHTREFTRSHSEASRANPELCTRCHADPDCTQCHETHVHPGGAIGKGGQ